MLLVLSMTWLSRGKTSAGCGDVDSLFVHKAIAFKRGGRSSIELYNPPRRVTYLINQLTAICTDGLRADGDQLEVSG